jgi:hypothetical protein
LRPVVGFWSAAARSNYAAFTERKIGMQREFVFVEEVTVRVRKSVCTLLRFTAKGQFNDRITLAQWLAFYSPLNAGWAL